MSRIDAAADALRDIDQSLDDLGGELHWFGGWVAGGCLSVILAAVVLASGIGIGLAAILIMIAGTCR